MRKRRLPTDPFQTSAYQNNKVYNNYYFTLAELAMNMFEWENLPETCDERYMELKLFTCGMCFFFQDEILGYLTLSGVATWPFNCYGIPQTRRALGFDGQYQKELTGDNSVIIYNNYLHEPLQPYLTRYSHMLELIDRTIQINVNALKTPVMISADESQKLSMENAMMKYDGGQPFIFTTKGFDKDNISVLDLKAQYHASNLQELKEKIWNEALSFVGVDTINTEKKERMITAEVEYGLGYVDAMRNIMLNMRRKACKEINEKFGLNVSVKFRNQKEEQEWQPTLPNYDPSQNPLQD